MAKAVRKNEKLDFSEALRALKADGPGGAFLLWGEEDYLRERYFDVLRSMCLGDAPDEFNHRRINGQGLDIRELNQAVDSMPFFSEHTLVEVRGLDLNKCRDADAEALRALLKDIPDYCTLVFLPDEGFEPDGRLALIKDLRKTGREVRFTPQEQSQLTGWIRRHFKDAGKDIGRAEAEHLVMVSGSLMTRLLPEIEKVANYAKGDTVTIADIDAAAIRVPEAEVFDMTERLAAGDFDGAASKLADLLATKNHPIMLLSIISQQLRRLYAARLAIDGGLGRDYLTQLYDIRYDFISDRLMKQASAFKTARLAHCIELCADYDYAMKSSGDDDEALLKELLERLALGR